MKKTDMLLELSKWSVCGLERDTHLRNLVDHMEMNNDIVGAEMLIAALSFDVKMVESIKKIFELLEEAEDE